MMVSMTQKPDFRNLLTEAVEARSHLFQPDHQSAFRLFNGFTEGEPSVTADLFARTLLLHNFAKQPDKNPGLIEQAESILREMIPGVQSVIRKSRYSKSVVNKNGLVSGDPPDTVIEENDIRYAVDLCLNQDASFYLDTKFLRTWLKEELAANSVLNAFAYTGSLGVAALAGGASEVIHLDLNDSFLDLARASTNLNSLPYNPGSFLCMDFWSAVKKFKMTGIRFDCIILDPPFFSKTDKAVLDLNKDTPRLINKIRPLIHDGGKIILVNNALFLSGNELITSIEPLCHEGYMTIDRIIGAPEDVRGYPHTLRRAYPVDPAPFNHPTKIMILSIHHTR
jgi:23S rRNA (cytosine1962-C5)-methyltransferase